ncbi:hydroxyacid dehydrogenase [Candidatus Pacearchaeota archaeon]|nr:hydroxyacid dehydrogenase [Candidatus Pacearchaeota archaeon]
MKIGFFEIEDWEKEYLKSKLKNHNLVFFKDVLNNKNVGSVLDVDAVSVFIYSKVDKEILKKFKKLKAVITRSTGFDHIDIKECKKRKISVMNVPYYGENTVAEHTFALILSLSRKIHKSYERTVRGNFSLEGLRGFDLKGKTLGIVGLGHIGKHVARIAKGFYMNILVYDLHRDKKAEKKLGLKFVSLENLLKNSDVISLHCPYNKKTHHLINNKNIKLIKKDAYIINTARGGLIETKALVKTLVKGNLGGVALDVLEEESLIKEEIQLLSKNFPKENLQGLLENHLLLTFDNVIITPHNAFNSQEALQRILDVSIENIQGISGKIKCKNIVKT